MSRIGKQPIVIVDGVTVTVKSQDVTVKGPKGTLSLTVHPNVRVELKEKELLITIPNEHDRKARALWGMTRSLVQNLVTGVSTGFAKKLEINGVGYRAAVKGKQIELLLGFSHPVLMDIPTGLEVKVTKNVVDITGPDKQMVGDFAAQIRSHRPPEPYKGKGIKYDYETVRRKAGKVVKAVGE